MSLAAPYPFLQQMDAFMEDIDTSSVLPIPSTAYDTMAVPQDFMAQRSYSDSGAFNMADLDELVSPFDVDPSLFTNFNVAHTPSVSEDGSSEIGEAAAAACDEVFTVDLMEEVEEKPISCSLDTPLRPTKAKPVSADKRYSPYNFANTAAMSPGRQRAKSIGSKLSSSLPAPSIAVPPMDNKRCACCGCSNTPMWRDGRDGQRLCNACGIRWQKYGVCCSNCHYVPRKLENNSGACRRCQAILPPPVPTRRRSSSTSLSAKPN